MSLKINKTEIPSSGNLSFNNTQLSQVNFNGSKVWEKIKDPIILVPNASLKSGWSFRINNKDDGNGANAGYAWNGNYLDLTYGSMGASSQARYYIDTSGYSTISFQVRGTLDWARICMGLKDDWVSKWSDSNWIIRKEEAYPSQTGVRIDTTFTLNIKNVNKKTYCVVYAYGGSVSSKTITWLSIKLNP